MKPLLDYLITPSLNRMAMKILFGVAKFGFSMILTTIICTWAWDAFLNGKVYYCTDGGTMDYWFVGDWVHPHSGHPVEVVPKIVPTHDMNDPDTIKEGWSVPLLWVVWLTFFLASLGISLAFALIPWLKTFDQMAERRRVRLSTS